MSGLLCAPAAGCRRDNEFRPTVSVGESYSSIQRLGPCSVGTSLSRQQSPRSQRPCSFGTRPTMQPCTGQALPVCLVTHPPSQRTCSDRAAALAQTDCKPKPAGNAFRSMLPANLYAGRPRTPVSEAARGLSCANAAPRPATCPLIHRIPASRNSGSTVRSSSRITGTIRRRSTAIVARQVPDAPCPAHQLVVLARTPHNRPAHAECPEHDRTMLGSTSTSA
jgi:hypothetical protein